MDKKLAVEILTDHNRWRRSEDEYNIVGVLPKYNPEELGIAIDYAIKFMNARF